MSPEKTEDLFNRYPMLYRGKDEGLQNNLMAFGFECGDGWFDLIDELSRQICELSPMTKAFQVKEKYGTLRFYVDGGESVVFDIIDDFEECSGKICEECGAPKGEDHGSNVSS
jgi:hypothetical protein